MDNTEKLMEILIDRFLKNIDNFLKKHEGTNIFIPLLCLLGTSSVLLSITDKNNKFSKEIEEYIRNTFDQPYKLMEKILEYNRQIN